MLICPICEAGLEQSPSGAVCENRHSFDRARQGYLNLLPVQHKASRAPGDNAAMVQARRSFLSAGHYRPVADFLLQQIAAEQTATWLDIGCGEGYYTELLAAKLEQSTGYALDISKEAVIQACKRSKAVNWLVASMARIPLAAGSMDLLTSIFSPLDWQEVKRLLTSDGRLLHLGPADDHLLELRSMIYESVRFYDDAKHLEDLQGGLEVTQTEFFSFTLDLPRPEDRHNLLAMTPHGQRSRIHCDDRVMQELAAVTVSVRLDCIQRSGD